MRKSNEETGMPEVGGEIKQSSQTSLHCSMKIDIKNNFSYGNFEETDVET